MKALFTNTKLILLFTVLICIGIYFYIGKAIFDTNVSVNEENEYIEIPSESSFNDVLDILENKKVLINKSSFIRIASLMRYTKDKVPAGRYRIKPGMSNKALITKLRSGDQDPVKLVVNNVRLISDLAGKASKYLEKDSSTYLQYFIDSTVYTPLGFNRDNFLSMFIPNTYEMFWTTGPEKFVKRMKKEYDDYWTEERVRKITERGLNKTQAYIIASIVEKESNYDPERPKIAGVYLNRFLAGEKLQADPTVVFATGDFTIQRVLYEYLSIDSPYNTYRYAGLPPGPICMPSVASLEAVVNAERHKLMFFCAKADNSGTHAFAETYAEHQKNADEFARWLNAQGIKK
jgi:UPF0755 protein